MGIIAVSNPRLHLVTDAMYFTWLSLFIVKSSLNSNDATQELNEQVNYTSETHIYNNIIYIHHNITHHN